MIKIYSENYYLVIELPAKLFDKVTDCILPETHTETTKILLGNEREIEYLSELLDVEKVNLETSDYFKCIKI